MRQRAPSELTIRLEPRGFQNQPDGRRAQAEVQLELRVDGSRTASESVEFLSPLTDADFVELRWYEEQYPHWPSEPLAERAIAVEGSLSTWGKTLFDALIAPALPADLLGRWSRSRHPALHLQISRSCLDTPEARSAAAHLWSLPWELLADGDGLFVDPPRSVAIVRKLDGRTGAQPARATNGPCRVLLVSARPEEPGVSLIDPRATTSALLRAHRKSGGDSQVSILTDAARPGASVPGARIA